MDGGGGGGGGGLCWRSLETFFSVGPVKQNRSTLPTTKRSTGGDGRAAKASTSRLPPLKRGSQPGLGQRSAGGAKTAPVHADQSLLLGDLHADKVYLEKLLQNPSKNPYSKVTASLVA